MLGETMNHSALRGHVRDVMAADDPMVDLPGDDDTFLYQGDIGDGTAYLIAPAEPYGDTPAYNVTPLSLEQEDVSRAIARYNAVEGGDIPLTADTMDQHRLVADGPSVDVTLGAELDADETPLTVARDVVETYADEPEYEIAATPVLYADGPPEGSYGEGGPETV